MGEMILSRRALLSGATVVVPAVALSAASAGTAFAGPGGDAPLLALCRRVKEVNAEIDGINSRIEPLRDLLPVNAVEIVAADRELDALWEELFLIWDKIDACRPVTLAGVLEKMRLFPKTDDEYFGHPDKRDWSATFFLSALADLERVAGSLPG